MLALILGVPVTIRLDTGKVPSENVMKKRHVCEMQPKGRVPGKYSKVFTMHCAEAPSRYGVSPFV